MIFKSKATCLTLKPIPILSKNQQQILKNNYLQKKHSAIQISKTLQVQYIYYWETKYLSPILLDHEIGLRVP